ncbi:hypothetical protein [Wenjunlia tyrosinilytica]
MVVRLPWAGDLGMHAAVLERLIAHPAHPGNPLVDADTPSPYYSPWTVALALLARATGATTFQTLRIAALIDLVLLVSGLRLYVRTFTRRRWALPLAVLCPTLLCGVRLFTWSGYPGLTSLSLCLAYPSTFALGLSFHLWALVRRALRDGWRLPGYLGPGLMLAVIASSHQFTGVVAVLGVLGVVLGARPRPSRRVWPRLAAGAVLALVVLGAWPYYSFFSLLTVGGLEEIHRPLYQHLLAHFGLVLLGVAALTVRFRRDRRDPLVLFFALGALVYTAGGLTAHWSWGRVQPAMLIPAQIALAVEVAGASGRAVRRVLTPLTAAALLVGAWVQAGTLGYVLREDAVPPVLRGVPAQKAWRGYGWLDGRVADGDTVMTKDYFAQRMIPAYGPYTVAPAYPDFFLPDERQRHHDVERYFADGTPRRERAAILAKYHVRWIVSRPGDGGLAPDDPAVRLVERGPRHEQLLRFLGGTPREGRAAR